MRNLKFRFYAKKSKKFITLPRVWMRENGELNYDYEGEDLIVNQWTGLLDKNGMEIYEGDILNSDYKPIETYEFSWYERGIVKYYPVFARFGLEFYSPFGGEGYTGKEQHISDYIKDWDLIGNVYENPELLNKEN